MNTRIALPILTLVTALFSLPLVQCEAASMPVSNGITQLPEPEPMSGDAIVASSNDLLHGNGRSADKTGVDQATRPQLKPDYTCQNLHVREPTCPPR
jgi:hypothetical protein